MKFNWRHMLLKSTNIKFKRITVFFGIHVNGNSIQIFQYDSYIYVKKSAKKLSYAGCIFIQLKHYACIASQSR